MTNLPYIWKSDNNIYYNPNNISHDNKINILVKVFFCTRYFYLRFSTKQTKIFFFISVNSSLYMSESEVEYFSFQVKTFPSQHLILPKTIKSCPYILGNFYANLRHFLDLPFCLDGVRNFEWPLLSLDDSLHHQRQKKSRRGGKKISRLLFLITN